jgi:uncharacterized membrane protein YqaE (UPF0057 family)
MYFFIFSDVDGCGVKVCKTVDECVEYVLMNCTKWKKLECRTCVSGDVLIRGHIRGNILGGGIFDDIFDPVIDVLESAFDPVIQPLKNITNVLTFITKLGIWIGNVFVWFGQFIYFLLQVLYTIPFDFVNSVILITSSVLLAIPQVFINLVKLVTNKFVKYIVSGFWGWDRVPADSADNKQSDKCYSTNGRVPFSVILGTILMPPIGVFMTLGLTGWLHILLATLLTLCFYIPGLIYALIIVYS